MWPFDQNNQQMYQQYAQAYDTNNHNGFDNNQIWGHLLQFVSGAPMDVQHRVYQQHFEQMPYEQRVALAQQMPPGYSMDPNNTWSMAQSFHRLGQEQPNMLQRVLSHPLLTGAALGLVGVVAKHALNHHQQQQQQQYSNQQPQYGYQQPQYGSNQGFQADPYAQQQLYQEQQENQELRSELRQEQQREQRLEEREQHHHRRDEW